MPPTNYQRAIGGLGWREKVGSVPRVGKDEKIEVRRGKAEMPMLGPELGLWGVPDGRAEKENRLTSRRKSLSP